FNNLIVQSGSWTLSGALTGVTSTSLNAGGLVLGNNLALRSGALNKPDADLRFIEGGAGFTTQGAPIAASDGGGLNAGTSSTITL
ncbi:hypothetical protein G3435_26260, partial [Pseudomonas sp. MAFF212428]|nr:hypothetical protein [Pseudomonas brassicae]